MCKAKGGREGGRRERGVCMEYVVYMCVCVHICVNS